MSILVNGGCRFWNRCFLMLHSAVASSSKEKQPQHEAGENQPDYGRKITKRCCVYEAVAALFLDDGHLLSGYPGALQSRRPPERKVV